MKEKQSKKVLSNMLFLSLLQIVNIVPPLIILPYLVQVLGINKFGEIYFVLSVILVINIFVGFGFDLSALQQVAGMKGDAEKVSKLFSSVLSVKLLLLLVSFFFLATTCLLLGMETSSLSLYLLTFGIIIGNSLFPTWLFQGMEDFHLGTYFSATAHLVSVSLIFAFVREVEHWLWVPAINSSTMILVGLSALALSRRRYALKFVLPTLRDIVFQLKDSFSFFLSRVANEGSRHYAIIVVGVACSSSSVGIYAIVDKLIFAFLIIGGVASQSIYPKMCRSLDLNLWRKVTSAVFLVSTVAILIASFIESYIFEEIFNISDSRIRPMFLLGLTGAIFGNLSTMLGYPLLAAMGFPWYANKSLIYAAIIFVSYVSAAAVLGGDVFWLALGLPLYFICSFLFRAFFVRHALSTR